MLPDGNPIPDGERTYLNACTIKVSVSFFQWAVLIGEISSLRSSMGRSVDRLWLLTPTMARVPMILGGTCGRYPKLRRCWNSARRSMWTVGRLRRVRRLVCGIFERLLGVVIVYLGVPLSIREICARNALSTCCSFKAGVQVEW